MPGPRTRLLGAAALLLAGLVVVLAAAGPGTPGVGLASATQTASPPGGAGSSASAEGSLPDAVVSSEPDATPAATPDPEAGATPGATTAPTPAPTVVPTAVPTAAAPPGPCPLFPASNVWNRDISGLPVAGDSTTLIASIGLDANLHPDFSATGYGIPINIVGPSTPRVSVSFQYDDESDPGPYPIPASPLIEGGSDRHILLWDKTACFLYELFAAAKSGGAWHAGSGAPVTNHGEPLSARIIPYRLSASSRTRACGPKPLVSTDALSRTRVPIGGKALDPLAPASCRAG